MKTKKNELGEEGVNLCKWHQKNKENIKKLLEIFEILEPGPNAV